MSSTAQDEAADGQLSPTPGPARAKKVKRAAAPLTPLARTRRARRLAAQLAIEFPDAKCELDFTTPLELAVATILSAQSTDVRVNMVTPALFVRYPDAAAYAGADRAELEEMVKSTGFFRNKANSLIGLGRELLERFDGEPAPVASISDLVTPPRHRSENRKRGAGPRFRRAGNHRRHAPRAFGAALGTDHRGPIPVRVVELELNAMLPGAGWTSFSDQSIYHGRRVCHAKKPACGACFLAELCPSYGTGPVEPQVAEKLVVGQERPHLLALVGLADRG